MPLLMYLLAVVAITTAKDYIDGRVLLADGPSAREVRSEACCTQLTMATQNCDRTIQERTQQFQDLVNQLQNQCLVNLPALQNGCSAEQVNQVEAICNSVQLDVTIGGGDCNNSLMEQRNQYEDQLETTIETCNNEIDNLQAQCDDQLAVTGTNCNNSISELTNELTTQANALRDQCVAQVLALQGNCTEQLNQTELQCNNELLEAGQNCNNSIKELNEELIAAREELMNDLSELRISFDEQIQDAQLSTSNDNANKVMAMGALVGILLAVTITLATGWIITCCVMRQNKYNKSHGEIVQTSSSITIMNKAAYPEQQMDNPLYGGNSSLGPTYDTLDIGDISIPSQPTHPQVPIAFESANDKEENIYDHIVSGDREEGVYCMPEAVGDYSIPKN